MNKHRLKITEKKYVYVLYKETQKNHMVNITPFAKVTLNTKSKAKAIKEGKELYPNIFICNAVFYSTIVKTYSISQSDNRIKDIIKQHGSITEIEVFEHE